VVLSDAEGRVVSEQKAGEEDARLIQQAAAIAAQIQNDAVDILLLQFVEQLGHVHGSAPGRGFAVSASHFNALAAGEVNAGVKRRQINDSQAQWLAIGTGPLDDFCLGFLVFQFAHRYPMALRQLTQWLVAGKLKYREDIVDGIDNAPRALIGMLNGRNMGKQLVKLSVP
jgi:hypothetical protein